MALVFQYGSNMSVARLNGEDRLAGDARLIGVVRTEDSFDLMFTVWSKSNACAAADLVPSTTGRIIYGVLYEVPDFLLSRDTAKQRNRKSLDAIEGEGTNYVRVMINLTTKSGSTVSANTYLVKERRLDIKTSVAYVQHILLGLKQHDIPEEYRQYVRSKIIENNKDIENELLATTLNP